MKNGHDMMGSELSQSPDFALGAVVNPNFEPLDLQLIKMEKKIAAGAQFFQTQTVYDPALFENFIRKTEGFGGPHPVGDCAGEVCKNGPIHERKRGRYHGS